MMLSSAAAVSLCRHGLRTSRIINSVVCTSTRFESSTSYMDSKRAAKQRRREDYAQRMARKSGLKARREARPPKTKKKEFQEWFEKRRTYQQTVDRKSRQLGLNWNIHVAAIVERIPIVLPDKPEWEEEYLNLKAYLNQFGKQYPEELKLGNPIFEEPTHVPTNEELMAMLPEGFTPAPRETEADKSGDVRTLNRRLKGRVYLTIKDKERSKWGFPTVALEDNETLLEGAQRAIQNIVDLELYCPSNCPVAVDMNVLPPEKQNDAGVMGTKIFYMLLQYDDGEVTTENAKVHDFAWLERSEVVERALNERGEGPSKFYRYMLAP